MQVRSATLTLSWNSALSFNRESSRPRVMVAGEGSTRKHWASHDAFPHNLSPSSQLPISNTVLWIQAIFYQSSLRTDVGPVISIPLCLARPQALPAKSNIQSSPLPATRGLPNPCAFPVRSAKKKARPKPEQKVEMG